MKIGIQTWGSDGDIRPFLALASGLSGAGHVVSVVITSVDQKNYSQFGKEMGFAVDHVGRLEYSDSYVAEFARKLVNTRIPIKEIKIIFGEFFDPVADEMHGAALELCAANDLLIGHFAHHPAQAAAEQTGRPYVSVTLNHSGIESRYTTPVGCLDIGNWANPLWWKFAYMVVDSALRPQVNQLRKKHGLSPVRNVLKEAWTSERLNLIAVSSALCREQPDWHPAHKVCGFFNMKESDEQWEIPADLEEFLAAGPAPVYLTLGSMLSLDPSVEIITRILVDGARQAGCRALVQSRWDDLGDFPDYPEVYKIQTAPHQHLFRHCAAVVHHGGAGTTQTALFHGCPSIIIEHFGDQLFWSHQLRRLGIAARPLHRRSITVNKLAAAIRTVLDSSEMKQQAETTGALMRGENGVEQAVKLIQEVYC